MPALNFQKQFAESVEKGTKTQSIRAIRKDWEKHKWEVGDKLYLYTGMRTANCRKLGEGIIKSIDKIFIDCDDEYGVFSKKNDYIQDFKEIEILSLKDGFKNVSEMINWFEKTHGLPFTGNLIKWELS